MENAERAFLQDTPAARRKGSKEGRSTGVKGRREARVRRWGAGGERKEREMIIHSTVITQRGTVKLTRQEIRPTDHPSFRSPLLHRLASPRLASPRLVPLSVRPSFSSTLPLPLPRKPRSGQLTPGYMQTTATVPPGQS